VLFQAFITPPAPASRLGGTLDALASVQEQDGAPAGTLTRNSVRDSFDPTNSSAAKRNSHHRALSLAFLKKKKSTNRATDEATTAHEKY
jgi:hypothetical protein